MGEPRTLVLYARDEHSRTGLRAAATRRGLTVVEPGPTPAEVAAAAAPGSAFRAPGGLLAQALDRGVPLRLSGPTPEWFAGLGPAVTGRAWHRVGPAGARGMLTTGPVFVKLADAKSRLVPARRYPGVAEFDAVMAAAGNLPVELLATRDWLDIDSEYPVFTRGREVLTASAYRVQDEPWGPLLHTHRASFHVEAAAHVADLLGGLSGDAVPPAAVLDVARLADGRLVVLEANQAWGSGLYGCDPDAVLGAVLAANDPGVAERWRWRPDPAAVPPL
ncbi:ATP-grasp domain-containing protein [Nakamurella deserti]|uniref:ATP-grasp domain-containing protein n=1 Tax=Nakamurella deserti TaxID=2164074 RepID=UPI001300A35D|nr:ATP-grasp domain-containing protein [Nakamurella deserti]